MNRGVDPRSVGTEPSLRELGYRMPAEWEHHESTWISWPHNEETWPEELESVERTMAHAVRALARSEKIRINVNSREHENRARRALRLAGVTGDIIFHNIPTNDAWVRDYGPIFVRSDSLGVAGVCFGFNSWGGKYPPYDLDDAAAARMAHDLRIPAIDSEIILEGGSIDVNGEGLLMTTESCLLNPNRNPHLARSEIEAHLRDFLGVDHVIWLKKGIAGDDTDGHIDDLARFVGPMRVVTVVEADPANENFDLLRENFDILKGVRNANGSALEIVELPMPAQRQVKGQIVPASYANFFIGNDTVLVPTFEDAKDADALTILQGLFSDREIVGLYCGDLIWGLGAFHCLTQQVPAFTRHQVKD